MAETTTGSDEIGSEASRLYWDGSDTVEDLVDRLGISKNVLYSSIIPLPAGVSCGVCGERMVYRNRSNRSSGVVSCSGCGRETTVDADDIAAANAARTSKGSQARGWDTAMTDWRRHPAEVAPQRIALVGGAAALGVMAGMFAGRAFREL